MKLNINGLDDQTCTQPWPSLAAHLCSLDGHKMNTHYPRIKKIHFTYHVLSQ